MASGARRDLRVNIEGDEGPLDRSLNRSIAKLRVLNKELDKTNRDNKKGFLDLGKAAQSGTDVAQGAFSGLFSMVGKSGPASVALLIGAIAALPAVSIAAAGAITTVLGGALLGVGILAASQSSRVKGTFEDLVSDIKAEMRDVAEPLEDSLIHASGVARRVFGTFKPHLERAFSDLAPRFEQFLERMGDGFEQLAPAVEPLADAFGDILDELGLAAPEIFDSIKEALTSLAGTASEHADVFVQFIKDMAELVEWTAKFIGFLADAYDIMRLISGAATFDLQTGEIMSYSEMLESRMNPALDETGSVIGKTSFAFTDLDAAAGGAKLSADGLAASLDELNGPAQSAEEASLRVRDSLLRIKEAADQGRTGWSLNTEAGVRNRQMILQHIGALEDDIVAQADNGKSTDFLRARWTKSRAELIRFATQLTGNRETAKRYVDQLLKTPEELKTKAKVDNKDANAKIKDTQNKLNQAKKPVTTTIRANTAPAQNAVQRFLASIPRVITTTVNAVRNFLGFKDGGPVGFANGGRVNGPGGSRADRVPAMLSRGEFVMNSGATARNLPALQAMNSGRTITGGSGGMMHVTLQIGDQVLGEIMIDPLRKTIRTRGGNVQATLGSGR